MEKMAASAALMITTHFQSLQRLFCRLSLQKPLSLRSLQRLFGRLCSQRALLPGFSFCLLISPSSTFYVKSRIDTITLQLNTHEHQTFPYFIYGILIYFYF